METERTNIIASIEATIGELKSMALPRDLAELRELVNDAKAAASREQLQQILRQATNLREFLERRKKSTHKQPTIPPPPKRS